MTRTPVLRGAALAAAALATLTITGCAAGQSNETEKSQTTITPRNAQIGDLRVRAAYVAPAGGGNATSGYVVAAVANTGTKPDTLTGVTVDGGDVSGGSNVQLPPQHVVSFADPATGASGQTLTLTTSSGELKIGTWVTARFAFQNAGTLTMRLPIEPSYGTTQVETPAPTGEPQAATASPSETPSATGSPLATPSESVGPSVTASPTP